MLMKQKEFRKLVRSMKHLEYHWAQYKKRFPEQTWGFRYRINIESYIYRDKKALFRSIINIPIIKRVYLSPRTNRQLKQYAKISRLLRTSLKKNKPQKQHKDKTYQIRP